MGINLLYDTLLAKLVASWNGLPDKPDENPDTTLRALWLFASGNPISVQKIGSIGHIDDLPLVDEATARRLTELVDERISGVPLSYLTGRESFMGVELLVAPGAVIPRKETEILGIAALAKLREIVQERGSARVIDLCTGSGNLPLALAFHEPRCTAFGSDLSNDAITVAERNAKYLGLVERVSFAQGDLFAPFESPEFLGQIDLVTCNPPYISSAKVDTLPHEISGFEPRYAFDGGPFGVKILTSLVREARRFLKPNSWLCFEVGLGQGKAMEQMCSRSYQRVETCADDQGQIRAVLARA